MLLWCIIVVDKDASVDMNFMHGQSYVQDNVDVKLVDITVMSS